MWRESCSKTREKLTDPYLRAAFAFLTSETESHEAVLVIALFLCLSKSFLGFFTFCIIYQLL